MKKKFFAILMACAIGLALVSPALASVGDGNVDSGDNGGMGNGSSQNFWNNEDGARLSILKDGNTIACFDWSNQDESSVKASFVRKDKLEYLHVICIVTAEYKTNIDTDRYELAFKWTGNRYNITPITAGLILKTADDDSLKSINYFKLPCCYTKGQKITVSYEIELWDDNNTCIPSMQYIATYPVDYLIMKLHFNENIKLETINKIIKIGYSDYVQYSEQLNANQNMFTLEKKRLKLLHNYSFNWTYMKAAMHLADDIEAPCVAACK